ncbi:MAG: serine/threonine protein kinase [Myxococcales bacterium]|nr:serine/threonine protein kinase [Myxococcales bacterium]
MLAPGQRVGRFRVSMRLGEGGMGAVYLAVDETLGREVAVKVMHDDLARDAASVQRFRREALAVARLSHPGVVLVYDLVEEPGRVAIVMERLRGESLRQRLTDDGPFAPGEVVAIVRAVLEALAAAHAVSILHRDLKPANVFLTSQGEVKLLDFGVARLADATRLTETGELLGTVRYMAPELLRGEEASSASDLYAVGVLAYELLTGAAPFAGTGVELMIRVREGGARPLGEVAPHVPEDLARAIDRALARDPAARFASAEAMLAALPAAARARVVVRAAERPPEAAPPSSRARPRALGALVAAAALLGLLGVAGLGVALVMSAPVARREAPLRSRAPREEPRPVTPEPSTPIATASARADAGPTLAAPKRVRLVMRGLGGGGRDAIHDEEDSKTIHAAIVGTMPAIAACIAATPTPIRSLAITVRPGGPSRCSIRAPQRDDGPGLECCLAVLDKVVLPPGDYDVFTHFDVVP